MVIKRHRCAACKRVEEWRARPLIDKLDAELLASGTERCRDELIHVKDD
jgi:hypothetical protein